MAMYTLVRGKVKLKDEFIEEVDMCIKHDSFKEFAYKFAFFVCKICVHKIKVVILHRQTK